MDLVRNALLALAGAAATVTIAVGSAFSGSTDVSARAGEVMSAYARPQADADRGLRELPDHVQRVLNDFGIDVESARLALTMSSPGGVRRVYHAPKPDRSELCSVAVAEDDAVSVSCNSLDTFSRGRGFDVAISSTGSFGEPRNVQVRGVASDRVGRIEIYFDSVMYAVEPGPDGGFWLDTTTVGLGQRLPTMLIARSTTDRIVGMLNVPTG